MQKESLGCIVNAKRKHWLRHKCKKESLRCKQSSFDRVVEKLPMQLLTASTTVYRPSKPVRHKGRYEAASTNSLCAFLGAGENDERVDAAETE